MDGGLTALQIAEIADAVQLIFCSLVFVIGVGIWAHATFFMKDD